MEKYFVCCEYDSPTCLRFSLEDAIADYPTFIDVFAENGVYVCCYEWDGTKEAYVRS